MSIRSFVFWLVCAPVSAMAEINAANQVGSDAALSFVEILEVGDNRWRATGTVSTEDQIVRIAIIEDIDTGAAVLIRQGSSILGDVQVENVRRDSVTFFVDGKRVNLRLGSGTSRAIAKKSTVAPVIEIEKISSTRFGVNYDNFRTMLSAASMYSSKDSIVRVRNSDFERLLQIKTVHPSGVLDRLGLEAGDVIIAMQGEAIDGPMHAKEVLNEVQPGSTLWVVYRRAGAIRQLSIEVEPEDGKR